MTYFIDFFSAGINAHFALDACVQRLIYYDTLLFHRYHFRHLVVVIFVISWTNELQMENYKAEHFA